MPDTNHPPYGLSQQQPRQLNRWLDVNSQNGPLGRTQTYITLPAFQYNVTYLGYSDIIAAYNFEGPNNFSLKNFTPPVNPNYTLCISWYDSQGNSNRYSLWRSKNDKFYFSITPYNGQLIKKNFRLEIWSSGAIASDTNTYNFYTSVLGQVDYRFGIDSVLINPDVVVTAFSCPVMSSVDALPVATDWFAPINITATPTWAPSIGTGSFSKASGSISKVNSPFGVNSIACTALTEVEFALSSNTTAGHNFYMVLKPLFANANNTIIIFDDGNSPFPDTIFVMTFTTNGGNNIFTLQNANNVGTSCNVTNTDFGIIGIWLSLVGNNATATLYDKAGKQIGQATATVVTPDTYGMVIFEFPQNVFEFVHSNNTYNFQQHLQYMYGGFALPLTFPNNASSVTN